MNCDWLAPHYWWIEKLGMGRTLERRRRWFLPSLRHAGRALVLGDGDGRFLRELLRDNLAVRADYVDLSARMLELARRNAGEDRVVYRQGDARALEFEQGAYDLITTHFFFDCFNSQELEALISRIAMAATPGARWVVSEFCTTSIPSRTLVRALYLFFRITTGLTTQNLVDYRPILSAQGFRLIDTGRSRGGFVISELWER